MTVAIKVDVVAPTTRQDGAAVTPGEVKSWRLGIRAQGASDFTPAGGVNDPSVTTRTIGGLTDGTYDVQTVWTDSDGVDGAPTTASITIAEVPPVKAPLSAGGMTLSQA